MAEPTEEQLKEYAAKLPQIYAAVLSAFPGKEPERRFGDALFEHDIDDYLRKQRVGVRFGDVEEAVSKLIDRGFLEHSQMDLQLLFPTPLGERLITVLTGHTPKAAGIPELPAPTWG